VAESRVVVGHWRYGGTEEEVVVVEVVLDTKINCVGRW
jgi:hypothetical protein